MKPNSTHFFRRYSSTGAAENTKAPSVLSPWNSWEILTKSAPLSQLLDLPITRKVRTLSITDLVPMHSEDHRADGEDLKRDVITRSVSLETHRIPFDNRELDERSTGIRRVEEGKIGNGANIQRNVLQKTGISELPSCSRNRIRELQVISDVKTVNESDGNVPSSSKGAIPKCKNISRPERKKCRKSDDSTGDDDDRLNGKVVARKKLSSNVSNRKAKDWENMKSLLHYDTHPLSKDVIDDGTPLLSPKPPLNTSTGRLITFKNWPNKRIQPKSLADAGFVYCGRADVVECYKCGVKGHNWLENDKPMEDHRRWNNDCPFVRENTTEHDHSQARQGQDICGNLGVEILPHSRPEDVAESETSLEKLGIQKTKGPANPDQILYDTRVATFENWPKSMRQKPSELADAGFYYLGVGDQTLCFYCGGGLKDWVHEDNPWEQHALWFPKCNFVLMKKTPAFVEAVHRTHKSSLLSKKEEIELEASCSSSNNDTKETPNCRSANSEERNSEESTTLCKICFKNELGVVFLPCGHMVACIDCATALKKCAVCRKSIQATVRAFLS